MPTVIWGERSGSQEKAGLRLAWEAPRAFAGGQMRVWKDSKKTLELGACLYWVEGQGCHFLQ